MNKLVKASIATGAALLLLMGGAGSLAYWNSTAQAGPASGGNTISAGTLSIAAANSGTWTKSLYNGAATPALVTGPTAVGTLSSVRIVPGNRLVYTQNFNVTASGDDLYFTVTSTAGAVTAASSDPKDVALAAQVNASGTTAFSVASITGGNVTPTGTTAGVYKLTSNSGTSTIAVTWTVDFPFGSSAVNSAQGGAISLSQGSITLTQVAAP